MTKSPPLKPAIGVSSSSGSNSMAMPSGGRPLVMAKRIPALRRALTELPAVVVKSVEDSPKQVPFVPHATLVGWLNDKEMLIVEDHLLVVYNVGSGARRKSSVRVEDAAHVFLR